MEPISIQSDIIYVNENISGWTLHRGQGERSFCGYVRFALPFEVVPHVIISLEDDEKNEEELPHILEIPVHCTIEEVSVSGFKYKLSTWGNNKISEVTARWIAMAQSKNQRL